MRLARGDFGQMQVILEPWEILDADRADDIDDGKLPRFAGDQCKPAGTVILDHDVHIHILAILAIVDLHQLTPTWRRQLSSDGIDVRGGVGKVGSELIVPDFNRLDSRKEFL